MEQQINTSEFPKDSSKTLMVRYKNLITYKQYKEELEAKFSFYSPCEWDQNIDTEGLLLLEQRFKNWLLDNGFSRLPHKFSKGLQGIAGTAYILSPKSWKLEFRKDRTSISAAKIFTLMKLGVSIFVWDDIIEPRTGTRDFSSFIVELSALLGDIMAQKFHSPEDLESHLKAREHICGEDFEFPLKLQLHLALELRDFYGVDTSAYPHLPIAYRNTYGGHAWCGGVGTEHLNNKWRTGYARFYTSTYAVGLEYVRVLDKLQVPLEIREDMYWKRLLFLAVRLMILTNDVVSLPMETMTPCPDNQVIFYIENGLSFREAVCKTVQEYEDVLSEAKDIIQFVTEGNHSIPKSLLPLYLKSFSHNAQLLAGAWQCQFLVSRYEGVTMSLEKNSI